MSNVDYTIPRGKLYFDQFTSGTTDATGERYLGHTPEISVGTSVEDIKHYNSDTAENALDKSVTLRVDRTLKFTLDSIDEDNIAMFLLGSKSTVTQTSGTVTDESMTTSAVLDRYYQMGDSTANPSGVKGVTAVSVKAGTLGSETTKTLTTDYTADLTNGRIYIVAGGAITAGMSVLVTYTRTANSRVQIISGGTMIEGAFRHIADNKTGTNRNTFWPQVSLKPDGDFAMKGNDWQKVGFTADILKLGTLATTYVDGVPA